MKISRTTLRILYLLLFCLLIQLSACTDREASELLSSNPSLQMDSPTEDEEDEFTPCGCITSPLSFNSDLNIVQIPVDQVTNLTGFTATVSGIPDCDISGCNENKNCKVTGHSYRLAINNSGQAPLTFSDFPSVEITDLEGGPIESTVNSTVIKALHPFSATFLWDSTSPLNETFAAIQLIPGGICIIDVLTDPTDNGDGSIENNDGVVR